MLTSGVKCSWVKCSESRSNMVSNIIRRYTDYMKFVAYMAFGLTHSCIIFWLTFLSLYIVLCCVVLCCVVLCAFV
jgi:hypothetical protein